MKIRKKSLLASMMAFALIFAAVMGTIAYMTASTHLINVFTVGGFNKPTDPDPDPEIFPDDFVPDNFLEEPHWVDQSALVPGSSIAKDPYVGIGANSADDAWAYIYVDSAFADGAVTFNLNTGWEVVDATPNSDGSYNGGLFKYSTALKSGDKDVWTTTPLFSEVVVADDINLSGLTEETDRTMTVYAFLHQANDGGAEIAVDTVDGAAKTWAAGLSSSNP